MDEWALRRGLGSGDGGEWGGVGGGGWRRRGDGEEGKRGRGEEERGWMNGDGGEGLNEGKYLQAYLLHALGEVWA